MKKEKKYLPGYPDYALDDVIYNKDSEEDLDPEYIYQMKTTSDIRGKRNEKDFIGDSASSDPDVSGNEHGNIGNEDEENSYYSVGGDNHLELVESQGNNISSS